ncbi:MAG: lysine 2,3-aminomutase, partial [Acidobacteriota bacterium]
MTPPRLNAMARAEPSRSTPRFRQFDFRNFRQIPQLRRLDPHQIRAMEVVARILPFRTNNYVIDELIDWTGVPDDPIFTLTFPRREMLLPMHFREIAALLDSGAGDAAIQAAVRRIRRELNPHPAGQLDANIPFLSGERMAGMQHKYAETLLFFPAQGQTCHAYCTFCFRWPQFIGGDLARFGAGEAGHLIRYLRRHRQITDVLFTGGDPMIMQAKVLASYIDPLLKADLPGLMNLRLGTKALSFWPRRFVTDGDAGEML